MRSSVSSNSALPEKRKPKANPREGEGPLAFCFLQCWGAQEERHALGWQTTQPACWAAQLSPGTILVLLQFTLD